MTENIKNILSNIDLDGPYFLRNSIVYNVLNNRRNGIEPLKVKTIETLAQETIEFCDINSQNSIEVFNHSDNNLFIFEGQLLKAGHQDRITLVSSLIESRCSNVLLPVACVEQGRSSGKSKYFHHGSLGFPSLRQEISRSLTSDDSNTSEVKVNQRRIWDFIDKSLNSLNVNSHTRSINDLYDQEEAEIIRYTDNISFENDTIGCLLILGKRLILDVFHPDIFSNVSKKLLHGYALEMLLHCESTNDPGKNTLIDWIDSVVSNGKPIRSKGIDLGENIKIEHDTSCGNGLTYNHEVLCLSLYNKCYQNN